MRRAVLSESLNRLFSSDAASDWGTNSSFPTAVSPAAPPQSSSMTSITSKTVASAAAYSLNGKKIVKQALEDGDIITFGLGGSYQIIFRVSGSTATTVNHLLSRIEDLTRGRSSLGSLGKINLLLEATMLLPIMVPSTASRGSCECPSS